MNRHIYNFCSEKAKNALQFFCENINESDADIFIVMAQKAVCLYRILSQQGLVLEKSIFSSVALDFNRFDFAGKHIAIVDDIIVSGSAISNITTKLLNAGVDENNIEIIALAQDTDYQTMRFTNTTTGENVLKCSISVPDVECIELSYEISRILAYYGMPYDADYPAYNDIRIKSTEHKMIEVSPLWETYDITTKIHSDGNNTVYTLFPTKLMKDKLWEILGIKLDSHIHLKLRIYLHLPSDHVTSLQIVPMALFNELSIQDTKKLFQWFENNVFPKTDIINGWNDHAKFRFLQYYIAHKLMSVFADELRITPILNDEVFSLQFGLTIPSELFSILQSKSKTYSVIVPDLAVLEPDLLNNSQSLFDTENISTYNINDYLILPFVSRHANEEMEAREALKNPRKHYINDYAEIKDLSQRLRRGLSLRALVKLAAPLNKQYDLEKVVSLFIDRAIDHGIIVPIFYSNKEAEYFCRAYRHGEDLPFGKADQSRILFFLKCLNHYFSKYKVDPFIATVSFEKIIVLFYQMGIRQGDIFNRFLGFDNYPLLRERFCVHGALATITSQETTHVYAEADDIPDDDYERWITSWLNTDGGIGAIVRTNDNGKLHYHIDIDKISENLTAEHLNNLSDSIKNEIEGIADVLAKWYSLSQNNKNKFKEDITALTSCYDSFVFASAIVTEIHYYYNYWSNQGCRAINTLMRSGDNSDFKYTTTESALYSGRCKAEWFKNKKADKVILDVSEKLKTGNGNWYLWNRVWQSSTKQTCKDIEEKTNEALCYLYFYSLSYLWLTAGRLQQETPAELFWEEDDVTRIIALFNEQSKGTPNVDTNILTFFKSVESVPNIIDRVHLVEDQMNRVLNCSEQLVNEVEDVLSKNTGTYSVRYESCLIIDLKSPTEQDSDKLLIRLWDSILENYQKTRFNIIRFGEDSGHFRYGLFYIDAYNEEQKPDQNEFLIQKYLELRSFAVDCGYLTRAIYIPRIPAKMKFMHDLKSHISQYTKDFSENLIYKLSENYMQKNTHQLLIFQTQDVGTSSIVSPESIEFTQIQPLPNIEIEGITEKIAGWALYSDNAIELQEKYTYSAVLIVDENNTPLGSGTLLSFNSKIYCITCAHVIKGHSQAQAYITGCATPVMLNILNYLDIAKFSDNTPPEKDIAILEPEWITDTPIDISCVFCIDDCITDIHDASQIRYYRCYGFPTKAGEFLTDITVNGINRTNCYSLHSGRARENWFSSGYSGAGIASEDGNHLLGIHRSHRGSISQCVPCQEIISALELLEKNYERGESL